MARASGICVTQVCVLGAPMLVAVIGERVYLFPPEPLPRGHRLLRADPDGLVRAGAGAEVTALIGPGRTGRLDQALAHYRDAHRSPPQTG